MKNISNNPVSNVAKIINPPTRAKVRSSARTLILLLLAVAITGCTKKSDVQSSDIPVGPQKLETKCVHVYYDKSADANFKLGKTYALMLLNLLGHFPNYQQTLSPVEAYVKGDLEKCDANFYVGAYFDNPLPADFLTDFKTTTKLTTWIGYNFWQLGLDFEKTFGYRDHSFTTLDTVNKTPAPDSKPSFFRDVIYKGETFTKYNEWATASSTTLVAPFEMAKLATKTMDISETLAEAKHSFTNEVIPWALKNKNKFYVTEIPFSYAHEGDRYMVFADLMFDFLGASPMSTQKRAIVRLADVNPMSQVNWLDEAVNIMKKSGVTPHLALQPIFNDPTFAIGGHAGKPEIRMEQTPAFASLVQQYVTDGSVFIWHGSAFEYANTAAGDNEFWNSVTNTPIAGDSPAYVLGRLDNGFKSLEVFNIAPAIWETPHYHASVLDNVMFGQLFKWTIGRGIYTDATISPLATPPGPIAYAIGASGNAANRTSYFSSLTATANPGYTEVGQIFPYEIYGDIYQQQVIPENLGGVLVGKRTAEKILADAKRNLVLRDCWASVYYQPYLLDPAVNTENASTTQPKDLERIVTGLKALGYTFVNLNDYVKTNSIAKGKARIEVN